jgi:hypothetical protein
MAQSRARAPCRRARATQRSAEAERLSMIGGSRPVAHARLGKTHDD